MGTFEKLPENSQEEFQEKSSPKFKVKYKEELDNNTLEELKEKSLDKLLGRPAAGGTSAETPKRIRWVI